MVIVMHIMHTTQIQLVFMLRKIDVSILFLSKISLLVTSFYIMGKIHLGSI